MEKKFMTNREKFDYSKSLQQFDIGDLSVEKDNLQYKLRQVRRQLKHEEGIRDARIMMEAS